MGGQRWSPGPRPSCWQTSSCKRPARSWIATWRPSPRPTAPTGGPPPRPLACAGAVLALVLSPLKKRKARRGNVWQAVLLARGPPAGSRGAVNGPRQLAACVVSVALAGVRPRALVCNLHRVDRQPAHIAVSVVQVLQRAVTWHRHVAGDVTNTVLGPSPALPSEPCFCRPPISTQSARAPHSSTAW